MKFIVDFMLGRLCKWLRLLGYNTSYFVPNEGQYLMSHSSAKKGNILYQSLKEQRIIITRNRRLTTRKAFGLVLLESDKLNEQIKEVSKKVDLKISKDKIFTRCIICNKKIFPVKKEQVKNKVPSYVYQTQKVFYICNFCGRIYWKGSHWDHIISQLKNMLK